MTTGKPKTAYLAVRLEPALLKQVQRAARERDMSPGAITRQALREWLDRHAGAARMQGGGAGWTQRS